MVEEWLIPANQAFSLAIGVGYPSRAEDGIFGGYFGVVRPPTCPADVKQ